MPETPPTPLTLFLAEHDVPCPNPKCGFNLRGLKGTTCPECKEPLSLCIAPRQRLSFAPLLVAVAFASLLIALATRMYISETLASSMQTGPSDWWSNLALTCRGRVSVPASSLAVTVIAVAALTLRESFLRMSDYGIAFW